jgi:hypothetical protein
MLFKETNLGRLILESIPMEKSAGKKVRVDPQEAVRIANGLAKVASYEYNPQAYHSLQEMMKMASDCILNLKTAFEESMEKQAQLEKAADIRVMVEDMALQGLMGEHEIHEKVAELMNQSKERLEIVKEAIKLAGSGKSVNIFFNEDQAMSKTASGSKRGMFDSIIGS